MPKDFQVLVIWSQILSGPIVMTTNQLDQTTVISLSQIRTRHISNSHRNIRFNPVGEDHLEHEGNEELRLHFIADLAFLNMTLQKAF